MDSEPADQMVPRNRRHLKWRLELGSAGPRTAEADCTVKVMHAALRPALAMAVPLFAKGQVKAIFLKPAALPKPMAADSALSLLRTGEEATERS